MVIVTLFIGFVLGALAVIGAEIVGILFFIRKLGRKVNEDEVKIARCVSPGREEFDFSFPNKQGWVWVLEKEKIPKTTDKESRQQKPKIKIVEVSPVQKYAKVKDQLLILTESNDTFTEIPLIGCTVEAVSATNLSSRKWAKRYPIKVESKRCHGSTLFYMYFDTSCEKESWCKALRLVSCDDKDKLNWFAKLRSEFHYYLTSLNIEYPSFLKPSIGFNPERVDGSVRIDGSSSKVRHFWKKLSKRTNKGGVDNRTTWTSTSGREDRKISEKSSSVQESNAAAKFIAQTRKPPNYVAEENLVQSASTHSGNANPHPDTDSVNKIISDDGTLCLNLLISRLFFDAKSNSELRSSMQARIQRTLSNMRTPSYIGEVICTGVDPGNLSPYIHGMRVLPSDLKEVMAVEIDFEYHGGAVLDIETRLEVRELDLPENSVGGVTTDLLEGFEYFGKQLKLSEGTVQVTKENGDEIPLMEKSKSYKGDEQGSSTISKWKSIVNSVAKQVSQVPLSLAIRVATLRGKLRVHINPPPSDQLWFGFTSMPDIDFNLDPCVGDHKITSGHMALYLINRFKAAIRETMVLPNCESISIPFMLAEKDDWLPQKTAPFLWINQEPTENSPSSSIHKVPRPQPKEASSSQEPEQKISTSSETTKDTKSESLDDQRRLTINESQPPSLRKDEQPQPPPQVEEPPPLPPREEETREIQFPNWQHPSPPQPQSLVSAEGTTDDARLMRMGTRARMLGLRKKMGEKLEEKRRNIEEKGRHIVEKMRGPGAS